VQSMLPGSVKSFVRQTRDGNWANYYFQCNRAVTLPVVGPL